MGRNANGPFNLPMDIIKLVFPRGTQYELMVEDVSEDGWNIPPNWPPDLFAISTYLLEMAGAYHHLTPGGQAVGRTANFELIFSKAQRTEIKKAAEEWRKEPSYLPDLVTSAWNEVITATRSVGSGRTENKDQLPEWWRSALWLAAYADETCLHLGHAGARAGAAAWVVDPMEAIVFSDEEDEQADATHVPVTEGPFSFCLAASPDILAVLPKSKTPHIGCTVRSMSQNLALMPSAGTMQGSWQQVPVGQLGSPSQSRFNCLFIPFPYSIEPTWFKTEAGGRDWKWFELEQGWLPEQGEPFPEFLQFIDALIERTKVAEPGNDIHGLLFPEYALRWDIYDSLVTHVLENHPNIQFIISGSSSNCEGDTGNYVLTTQLIDRDKGGVSKRTGFTTSRAKHHRWQINPYQIQQYCLEPGFKDTDKAQVYWEKIPLPRRQLHVNQFRNQSVLSTLICEDLARAEPVHQYIRAVGPNIIFVLLMDGAQLENRWAARYALGLAEDPGSAVITLTSRALVSLSNRQQERRNNKPNWSVGLARNPGGQPIRLECVLDAEATFLSFSATKAGEKTNLGSFQNKGWNWELKHHISIALDRDIPQSRELLDKIVRDYRTGSPVG